MLAERIIATITFFDLQNVPLTAFEVGRYLIAEKEQLQTRLDDKYELVNAAPPVAQVHLDTIISQLAVLVQEGSIEHHNGFYTLPNRVDLAQQRLGNYVYGIPRERRIRRYIGITRHLPFVRGIALAGSQAMGQQRPGSDIDLLIITDREYMWVARTILMVYFQLLGVRRHGKHIANRFCLNHYLGTVREVDAERNLYKAMEYTKLRPLVYANTTTRFQQANQNWIKVFFPNVIFPAIVESSVSVIQKTLEKLLRNRIGVWLESVLSKWQKSRIRQDQFVFVREDELSFHPDSKHEVLLKGFFE